jgi:hypothetical protein
MKKPIVGIAIICTVFITLLILNPPEITFEELETAEPNKPKSIPEKAFWVGGIDGGNFILISKNTKGNNVFSTEIYNDYTGDLEYSGTLKYSGVVTAEASLSDPAFYQGWDGEKLHLTNGEYMSTYKDNNLTKSSSGR